MYLKNTNCFISYTQVSPTQIWTSITQILYLCSSDRIQIHVILCKIDLKSYPISTFKLLSTSPRFDHNISPFRDWLYQFLQTWISKAIHSMFKLAIYSWSFIRPRFVGYFIKFKVWSSLPNQETKDDAFKKACLQQPWQVNSWPFFPYSYHVNQDNMSWISTDASDPLFIAEILST